MEHLTIDKRQAEQNSACRLDPAHSSFLHLWNHSGCMSNNSQLEDSADFWGPALMDWTSLLLFSVKVCFIHLPYCKNVNCIVQILPPVHTLVLLPTTVLYWNQCKIQGLLCACSSRLRANFTAIIKAQATNIAFRQLPCIEFKFVRTYMEANPFFSSRS